MKYVVSFLIGGTVFGAFLMEPAWGVSRFLIAPLWVHTFLYLGPLVLIAFVTGLLAAPRGALVALAAYVLGVALWVGLQLRPGPPGTSDVWGYDQWGYFILQMLPSAAISAIVGGIGSLLRSRRRRIAGQPAAGAEP